METPDFKALYQPYAKMVSVEDTITWILKECTARGVSADLAQKAINITFLEMAEGKTFPTDGGDTGFDGIPHAVMNIYVVQKALEMHQRSMTAYLEATEGVLKARIKMHVDHNKQQEEKARVHQEAMAAYIDATQGELQSRIDASVKRNKWQEYKDHLKNNSPIVKLFTKKDK